MQAVQFDNNDDLLGSFFVITGISNENRRIKWIKQILAEKNFRVMQERFRH